MELSFNVSGAGPLAQIGLHIIGFDTAVHLATGAVGWWKARERSQSLIQSLTACKAALVSSSTFDVALYRQRRQDGIIQGLGVQGEILMRYERGVESTATSPHSGIDCLRALTTGLLCLCDVKLTTTVLADVVPFGLLHGDQEDEIPAFKGPLLAALRDWVTSVAAEEDCNTFRRNLLQRVSNLQGRLTGEHGLASCSAGGSEELALLLGCLRWMITPIHRRDWSKYPTRSLRVWTIAAIMSELAFSISVSLEIIRSEEDYSESMSTQSPTDSYPDVVLVAASIGDTDPWLFTGSGESHFELRPQLTPLVSIPYIAFGPLSRRYSTLNPEALVDIWKVAYRYGKEACELPTLSQAARVHLRPASKRTEVIRDCHKVLLGLWSPHLAAILRPVMDDYVPTVLDSNWAPGTIKAFFDNRAKGVTANVWKEELVDNVHRLNAIILGTIYGACSKSLIPAAASHKEKEDPDFVEVAFSPDFILSSRVFDWAASLGQALSGLLELSRWTGLILELITGIEHPQQLDRQPSSSLLGRNLKVIDSRAPLDDQHVRISDIFGGQANGVFIVSDFLVRPPRDANNAVLYHVGTGRILNFPVDERGYLRASQRILRPADLQLGPHPKVQGLRRRQPSSIANVELRCDAEPDWGGDMQTMMFAFRRSGVLLGNVSISETLDRLMRNYVTCRCDQPCLEVQTSNDEEWQFINIQQFLQGFLPAGTTSTAVIREPDHLAIDVLGDIVSRLFVVGMLSSRRMMISSCIKCAYNKIPKGSKAGSIVLVIG